MTKQRHCYVTDIIDAIEKLADALDPERSKPFSGDILDLLEWAANDALAMRQQLAVTEEKRSDLEFVWNGCEQELENCKSEREQLRQQLTQTRDWFNVNMTSERHADDLDTLREERDAINKVLGELK